MREMVRQMSMPVEIVGGETVREADGLAMSSRNGYLDAPQRAEAPRLNRTLRRVKERIHAGERDFDRIVREPEEDLRGHGWKVDYVALRTRSHLAQPRAG